jgi:enoyl-[acyl-carrier protein] reductase III
VSATPRLGRWALVLGSSSGMGEACSIRLAQDGYDIFGVHLDRRQTQPHVEEVKAAIEATGRRAIFFNRNAASPETRDEVMQVVKSTLAESGEKVHVLHHSIAFGILKPLVGGDEAATPDDVRLTVEVMGNDVVYWTQALVRADLFGRPGRVFAMTSEGGTRVWKSYGPVSAAKAVLECHVRQLALELAPRGITVNALLAGVTDTPALRKIPGCDEMLEHSRKRNPHGRLTTPADVASALSLLCDERANWITGSVVHVDGGETAVA